MVEKMMKTFKHGLTIISSSNIQKWGVQIPNILFGYCCGILNSTKCSPYIIFTRTPGLTIDNRLNNLTHVVDDQVVLEEMVLQMVFKMELETKLHELLLENVDKAQKK
jgi:hypothetical protein